MEEIEKPDVPALDEADEELNHSTMYYNNMKQAKSYKFEVFDPIKELEDKKKFFYVDLF